MTHSTEIFVTQDGDGNFLAAHIDSPRFCVAAPTKIEALRKAERAITYFNEVSPTAAATAKPRSTRIVSPVFVPERVCA